MKILLIFLLGHLGLSQKCNEYSCKSSSSQFLPGQCIQSAPGPITLKMTLTICTDLYHSYCPPVLSNATCQLPPQQSYINIAAVGETCQFDENCLDSICQSGICTGIGIRAPCQRDTQCEVGLYCNVTCLSQVNLGDQCVRDEMCANNFGCYKGLCTKYFTIPESETIDYCTDNENYLCTSGACREIDGISYCAPASKSEAALPISCFFDDMCIINQPIGPASNFTTSCLCGYNGFGFASCGLAPGDGIYLNYTKAINQWLSSTNITNCHTTRRTDLSCIVNYWDYANYTTLAYFQSYALGYSETVFNDDCVKNVYKSYYWGLQKQYNALGQPSNPLKSAGFLIGLVSYFYI